MTFKEFCSEVNKLGWGETPPTEAPRHIFTMYVAGFEAGLTPSTFMKFMAVRAFVSTTTAALKNEKVEFSKGEEFLRVLEKKIHPKEAVPLLFHSEEVKDEHLPLFGQVA
jgi:hypothetical protein